MKKAYEAPFLEIESYELDASIASNCSLVITMGPTGGTENDPVCKDYYEKIDEPYPVSSTYSSRPHNVSFWETNCTCYYSASGKGFFTS